MSLLSHPIQHSKMPVETRASVLSLPIARGRIEGWYFPKVPHDTPEAIGENRDTLASFLDCYRSDFVESPGDQRRNQTQRHLCWKAFRCGACMRCFWFRSDLRLLPMLPISAYSFRSSVIWRGTRTRLPMCIICLQKQIAIAD